MYFVDSIDFDFAIVLDLYQLQYYYRLHLFFIKHNQEFGNKYEQKIQEVLKKMENTYWMIAVNVPEEIQKDIPDFRQGNQMADPIIKIWNDFKANPNQENFNAFIDAFKTFGTVSLNTSTNVNAGLKAAYSFNKKLMDNLNLANQRKYYNSVIEDYFDKTEFTL